MHSFRPRIVLVLLVALLCQLPAASAERLRGPMPQGEALARTAAAMLADVRQTTWIRDGRSKRVLYVFFDPNCPYCRKVYEGLRAPVELGEVELRWIPVGILMTTSLGKAASMLEAKDPTAALHLNEQRFTTEGGSFGGIDEEPAPREETLAKLAANLAFLRRSGQDAVPSLLFRTRDGRSHFVRGAPPPAVLEKIARELE